MSTGGQQNHSTRIQKTQQHQTDIRQSGRLAVLPEKNKTPEGGHNVVGLHQITFSLPCSLAPQEVLIVDSTTATPERKP